MSDLVMTLREAVFPVRESYDGKLEWRVDVVLLAVTVALLCLGWVMVSSASIDYAEQNTGNLFFFSFRHGIYLVISLLAMALVTRVPFNVWRRIDAQFLMLAIFLLLIVLVPGIGKKINGSQRWLNLGFMTLQASEIAKWATMVFFAGYFVRRSEEMRSSVLGFIKPFVVLGLIAALLLAEPDWCNGCYRAFVPVIDVSGWRSSRQVFNIGWRLSRCCRPRCSVCQLSICTPYGVRRSVG